MRGCHTGWIIRDIIGEGVYQDQGIQSGVSVYLLRVGPIPSHSPPINQLTAGGALLIFTSRLPEGLCGEVPLVLICGARVVVWSEELQVVLGRGRDIY